MVVAQSYHDLLKEIDILETYIGDLENEYKFWYHQCFQHRVPLDIVLKRMNKICDAVETYVTLLAEKEITRRQIEQRISELKSIDYEVCYRRDVLGMTLIEIAADLGYSEIWIKKISARNKKRVG